jgi:BlaI family penicillinase repressor
MKRTTRRASTARPNRARKTIFELPPLELECMKVLWMRGEATVRDIREQLAADARPLAYTTVETIMDRLTRKGAVERRRVGRAHRYMPVYQKADARAQAIAAVAEHFFDGSRRALAAHVSGAPAPAAPARVLRPPATPAQRVARRPEVARPSRARPPAAEAAIDTSLL